VLCQAQRAQGQLDEVVRTCHRTLEITAPPGRPAALAAGAAYVHLGEDAYQRDELDTALRHVTAGIALCRQLAYPAPLAAGLVTLAWIRQASGDRAGALDAIGEAGRFAPGPAVNGLLNPVPAERARLLLAQGDLAGAASHAIHPSPNICCSPASCSPRIVPVRPSNCSTGYTRAPSRRTGSAASSKPERCAPWPWPPAATRRTR
jgi:hypothetical protein